MHELQTRRERTSRIFLVMETDKRGCTRTQCTRATRFSFARIARWEFFFNFRGKNHCSVESVQGIKREVRALRLFSRKNFLISYILWLCINTLKSHRCVHVLRRGWSKGWNCWSLLNSCVYMDFFWLKVGLRFRSNSFIPEFFLALTTFFPKPPNKATLLCDVKPI